MEAGGGDVCTSETCIYLATANEVQVTYFDKYTSSLQTSTDLPVYVSDNKQDFATSLWESKQLKDTLVKSKISF